MAGEFLVKRGKGTLVVHALPETGDNTGIALPVKVLSLKEKMHITPPTPAVYQVTPFGPALLLDSVMRPEEDFGVLMSTRAAAGAVIDFFSGKPEVEYDVHDNRAHLIPDDFLPGLPVEVVETIFRARAPEPPTGMYL